MDSQIIVVAFKAISFMTRPPSALQRRFPTFLSYPFSIPTDAHVPLQFLMTKCFAVMIHRYNNKYIMIFENNIH